jgi:hypothetical protein
MRDPTTCPPNSALIRSNELNYRKHSLCGNFYEKKSAVSDFHELPAVVMWLNMTTAG